VVQHHNPGNEQNPKEHRRNQLTHDAGEREGSLLELGVTDGALPQLRTCNHGIETLGKERVTARRVRKHRTRLGGYPDYSLA
jgi:hypothetical protein